MSADPMPDIDDLAAGWFARQRAGDMMAAEAEALDAWLDTDPAHRAALDALSRAWMRAEAARDDPEILAWRERARRRVYWPHARAAAAVLLAAVLLGGAGWQLGRAGLLPWSGRFYDQEFQTDLGQRATFTLRDGSKVTLNTGTRLRTVAAQGRRLVYLDRGQAYFRVAKDASRPFVVKAGGRTITAIGTAFDVRVEPKRFEVTLVEGRVRVETPSARPAKAAAPQTTELTPGAQLVASTAADWSVQQTNTARETSWLAGRLMFENEPLGAVAEEFGRYSERRIVFADPELARTPVTGTFRSGDLSGFVRALEQYQLARVVEETDDTVRLAAW